MKLFNRLALVAVSAAMVFGFASCAQSDENPFNPALNPEDPVKNYIIEQITKKPDSGTATPDSGTTKPDSGSPEKGPTSNKGSIEFAVIAASTNVAETKIFVKYDRSAAGADEEVKVTDAEFNIYVNGTLSKTYNEIKFELDEYGESFNGASTPIADSNNRKEYKVKLDVGKQLKVGDVVKCELVKGTLTKVGAAAGSITMDQFMFALVDTDPSVNYYKELSETEYVPIVSAEDKPADKEPTPEYAKVLKLSKNTYATAPETQVKIATGFDSLAVGDKIVLKMKGNSSKAFKGEFVIIDGTEAANWWTELVEKLDKEVAAGDFIIEHTFVVTTAPIGTGADSMQFAINGKDHDEETVLSCTEFSLTKVGAEPSGPEGSPDSEGSAEETTIHDVPTEISWGDFVIVPGSNFTGTEAKTITIYYDCTTTGDENYTTFKIAANYNGAPLGDGVVTGGALNPSDKGAINNTGDKGETGKVVTYVPTAEEWASMSTGNNGLYINGYNIKINKITLK